MAQPILAQIAASIAQYQSEIAKHQAIIDGLTARIGLLNNATAIFQGQPQLQTLIDALGLDVRIPTVEAIGAAILAPKPLGP